MCSTTSRRVTTSKLSSLKGNFSASDLTSGMSPLFWQNLSAALEYSHPTTSYFLLNEETSDPVPHPTSKIFFGFSESTILTINSLFAENHQWLSSSSYILSISSISIFLL